MARTAHSAHALTDHEQILRWAQERGAQPACVRGTGGGEDVGMIRLDFPGYSGADSLESVGWDEWFQKFEENNLALLVQDEAARGRKSNFNKLVSRDKAEQRSEMEQVGRKRSEGRGARSGTRSTRGRVSGRRARATTASRRRSEAGTSSRRSAGRRAGNRSRSAHSRSSQTRSTRAQGRHSRANVRAFSRPARSGGKRSRRSVRESSRRRAA